MTLQSPKSRLKHCPEAELTAEGHAEACPSVNRPALRGYAPESLPPSHKATARQAAFAWDDGCNRTQVNNSVLQVQRSIINSPTEYRFSIKLSCRQGLAPGSLDFGLGDDGIDGPRDIAA